MNLSSLTMKAFAASLILASTTGLAFAKNYKGEANYKGESMAVPCPAPRMLMSGWYIGGQVGYDSYRVRADIDDVLGLVAADPAFAANGWVGGLYLGWGTYFTDWFYLGAEVDGNWTGARQGFDLTTSFFPFFSYENNFQARGQWGVSLIPGFRLNDTSLGYIRLGWNWANFRARETINDIFTRSNSHTANGFVWGAGIETLLIDNWSLRTEYNHTYYNSIGRSNNNFLPFSRTSWKASDNQFMLGLSYHFG